MNRWDQNGRFCHAKIEYVNYINLLRNFVTILPD